MTMNLEDVWITKTIIYVHSTVYKFTKTVAHGYSTSELCILNNRSRLILYLATIVKCSLT